MQGPQMNKFYFLITTLLALSCGIEVDKGEELAKSNSSNSKLNRESLSLFVNSSEDLPVCDKDREGQLVYIGDDEIFNYCKESAWLDLNIKGKNGESRTKGAKGDNGKRGHKGDRGNRGKSGHKSLAYQTIELAGSNCTDGGTKLDSGIDNGDGGGVADNDILEDGEIDVTNYICNGPLGGLIGKKLYTSSDTLIGTIVNVMYEQPQDLSPSYRLIVVDNGSYKAVYRDQNVSSYTYYSSSVAYYTKVVEPSARKSLTRYVHKSNEIAYNSNNCTGTGYIPYSSNGSRERRGNSYNRTYSLQSWLEISPDLSYALDSDNDYILDNNCSTPVEGLSFNSLGSYSGSSCVIYCSNPDVTNCSTSDSPVTNSKGCSFTQIPQQFPLTIDSGWKVEV